MIEALIVIGGIIGIAAVGLFVSGRMTKWWSSALYALLTASLAVLMVTGFYALDSSNTVAILWYARLSAVSVIVALTSLYFLTQELVDESAKSRGIKVVRNVVFVMSVIMLVLSFTPLVFSDIETLLNGNRVIDASWGVLAYIAFVVGVLALIVTQLVGEARTAYHRRHGVLDVRYVAVRTFSYVLALLIVALFYCLSLYLLAYVFVRDDSQIGFILGPVLIASALVGAMIFQPVRKILNRGFDQIFYKDNYSIDNFAVTISQTLNSTNDLRTLLERTAILIANTLKARQVFFFANVPEGRYITAGTHEHSKVSPAEFDGIQHAPEHRNTPLLVSQFDKHDTIHRMMVSHRLSLVMPLYKSDTPVGFLCLGRPLKAGYTNRDLRALRTIADELTIAIQNALSVEEVRKLNDTLEQRVDSATKELRTSNSQLQRLDEAKDEFISMASHQLRTPLTSIKGYISMLLEGDAGKITKEQEHFLNEAFVSSERMVRLIGDFLNVSRLQTGKFVIDKHPIDLALLVQHEIDGLYQNATARGITFIYKKPKNIPILDLDENKIQQVVMNLSDNAIYYSKEKSKVTVTLKKVSDFVEFNVTDSGIGVPESEQANLFNKFFRATNARRARPDGTGVGLFLAKKVIDEHDGEILFQSKEGKGSTFGFRLPIPK